MEDLLKYVSDYGITVLITVVVIFFVVNYGKKFLDISVKRMEDKNFMIDTLHKVVENNTKALENNSIVIKNYTDNAHKMEKKVDNLEVKVDSLIQEVIRGNTNIEVIKDRK